MSEKPNIGIYLCKCGDKIDPFVDLSLLEKKLEGQENIGHCEILPFPCLKPGMEKMVSHIKEKGLNRIIVAGCEERLMLKKFEKLLEKEGLYKGQIHVVNLRGHVANVSDISSEAKAEKGAKLIKASIAELNDLCPSIQTNVNISSHPPIILGGGVSSFTAAQELAKGGINCLLSIPETDPDVIMNSIHQKYLGEKKHYGRLRAIIEEVLQSPKIEVLPPADLESLSGVTGNYTLTFSAQDNVNRYEYKAGTIIACLDGELEEPKSGFGYDGEAVICQTDFEANILKGFLPQGQTIFWINDYEAGQGAFAQLSARSAWSMGLHLLQNSKKSSVVILYNQQMPMPLSSAERTISRNMGLLMIPYDKSVQPIIQEGYVNFGSINDHLEHELPWDHIVLSPIRKVGRQTMQMAKILGIVYDEESPFFSIHNVKVRPEMVGREETYLAGSAKDACDLSDALSQGALAGKKNVEMYQKSDAGDLFTPRIIAFIDSEKCVGCGQCQDLCDCNGIGITEGSGGGLPRIVDSMLCTGGGTCAAACPYQALTIQNNTNDQREARIAELSRQLKDNEFAAFACSWAGLPAADNAGNMGLKYDPNIHILGVPCVGQIDPSVMARAFLEGSPGLLLVGCSPEDCHHSFGVDHAWSRVNLIKKLFTLCGFDRRRITLAHADLNKPEEFVKTAESFAKAMATLGPIEKTAENQNKLESIYRLVKYNSRIRLLLSSGLRRPWEMTYRGDQRHALAYDRTDFMNALREELLKARLEVVFRSNQKQQLNLEELAQATSEDQTKILSPLDELIFERVINVSYKEGIPFYICN